MHEDTLEHNRYWNYIKEPQTKPWTIQIKIIHPCPTSVHYLLLGHTKGQFTQITHTHIQKTVYLVVSSPGLVWSMFWNVSTIPSSRQNNGGESSFICGTNNIKNVQRFNSVFPEIVTISLKIGIIMTFFLVESSSNTNCLLKTWADKTITKTNWNKWDNALVFVV